MKITIGETTVILACTAEGKQALKSDELKPRQRQFILLVEENSILGEQAVSKLLPKVNLQALVEKGWICCEVSHGQSVKEPVPIVQLASNIMYTAKLSSQSDSEVMTKKSLKKQQRAKDLQSFLNTYASEKQERPE